MNPLWNFAKKYTKTYIKVRKGSPTPHVLLLYVTNQCNARCAHCYYWEDMKKDIDELSLEEFEKIAFSLKEPLGSLLISGGEPFLREDLENICEVFADINRLELIIIPTNGSLTDKILETTKRILGRIDRSIQLKIQVSLDGREDLHDKIRGRNIFQQAAQTALALRSLKDTYLNLDVYVLTVLSNANYRNIEVLADHVQKKLGVEIFFEMIRGAPRDPSYSIPPKKELGRLFDKVKRIYSRQVHLERIDSIFSLCLPFLTLDYMLRTARDNRHFFRCLAGRHIGVVYPDGSVGFCELTEPIGNLREVDFNFGQIWNSRIADKQREAIKTCSCTHSCFLNPSVIYDLDKFLMGLLKYTSWKRLFQKRTRL